MDAVLSTHSCVYTHDLDKGEKWVITDNCGAIINRPKEIGEQVQGEIDVSANDQGRAGIVFKAGIDVIFQRTLTLRAGQTKILYPDDKLQFDYGDARTVYVVASSVHDGAPATMSLQEFSNRKLNSNPKDSDGDMGVVDKMSGPPEDRRVARTDMKESEVMDDEDSEDADYEDGMADAETQDEGAVEGASSTEQLPEWECQHCTFVNFSHSTACEVCYKTTYHKVDRSKRVRCQPSRYRDEQALSILVPTTSSSKCRKSGGQVAREKRSAADEASTNSDAGSGREEMETSVTGDAVSDDDGASGGGEQVHDESSAAGQSRAVAGDRRSTRQRGTRCNSSNEAAAAAAAAEAGAAVRATSTPTVSIATPDEEDGYKKTSAKRLKLSPDSPVTTTEGRSSSSSSSSSSTNCDGPSIASGDGSPHNNQGGQVDHATLGSTTPQTAPTLEPPQARDGRRKFNDPGNDGGAVPDRVGRRTTTAAAPATTIVATLRGKRRLSSRNATVSTAAPPRRAGPSRRGKTTGDYGLESSLDATLAGSNKDDGCDGSGGVDLGEIDIGGIANSSHSAEGRAADVRMDGSNGSSNDHQPTATMSNDSHPALAAWSSLSDSDSASTAINGQKASTVTSGENSDQRMVPPSSAIVQSSKEKHGKAEVKGKGKGKGKAKAKVKVKAKVKAKAKAKAKGKGSAPDADGSKASGGRASRRASAAVAEVESSDMEIDEVQSEPEKRDRFPDSYEIQDKYDAQQIAAWETRGSTGGNAGPQDDEDSDGDVDIGNVDSDESNDM